MLRKFNQKDFKAILKSLDERAEEFHYKGCDLSDLGSEIGEHIGKHYPDLKEDEIDDLIHGLKHGISLTNGTH